MDGYEAQPLYLNVPGLNGSGVNHWQTLWEQHRGDVRRVEQVNWQDPRPSEWMRQLNAAIIASSGPVLLIAHSLGCHVIASWAAVIAQGYGRPVAGALLVAPPEIERPDAHPILQRFTPRPRQPLPFPSILVASRNDRYATIEESRSMARVWQSHLVDIGAKGHINAESALGLWPDGLKLLDQLAEVALRRANGPFRRVA